MNRTQWITAFFILAWAAVLRFYAFAELEFQHDELSAIQRLDYPNLKQLLSEGVKPDGHPPLTQVFLYYFQHWAGPQAWLWKLPFALLNLASVALLILMGRSLNNPSAGLLSAAYLAVLQGILMYAQIIRPYGPGLFFSLLAGFALLNYPRQGQNWSKWLYPLAGAAALYSHHFNLLLWGFMFLSGLFQFPPQRRREFVGLNALLLLLYAPNLPLFWAQLQLGGIGQWLQKPDWRFPLDYLGYLHHYHWAMALLTVFFLALSFRLPRHSEPFRAGLWWLPLAMAIAFAYSLLIGPVLQYSVLVFFLPFLLLGLFSSRQWPLSPLLCGVVLLVGTISLYGERAHYPAFYRTVFGFPFRGMPSGKGPVLYAADSNKMQLNQELLGRETKLYLLKEGQKTEAYLRRWQDSSFVLLLDHAHQNHWPLRLMDLRGDTPRVQWGFGYSAFAFGTKSHVSGQQSEPWQREKLWQGVLCDSLSAEAQYSCTWKKKWALLPVNSEQYLVFSLQLACQDQPTESALASALFAGDSLVYWRSTPLRYFYLPEGFRAYHHLRFPAELEKYRDELELRLFLYAPEKLSARLGQWRIDAIPQNPILYGRYQNF